MTTQKKSRYFWIALNFLSGCLAIMYGLFQLNFHVDVTPFHKMLDQHHTNRNYYLNKQEAIRIMMLSMLSMERDVKDFFISEDKKYLEKFDRDQEQFGKNISALIADIKIPLKNEKDSLETTFYQFTKYLQTFQEIIKEVNRRKKGHAMVISRSVHADLVAELQTTLGTLNQIYSEKINHLTRSSIHSMTDFTNHLNIELAKKTKKIWGFVFGYFCLSTVGVCIFAWLDSRKIREAEPLVSESILKRRHQLLSIPHQEDTIHARN